MQLLPGLRQFHADTEKRAAPLPFCQPHCHEKLIHIKFRRASQILQGIILKCLQSIESGTGMTHSKRPHRLGKHREQCQMSVCQSDIHPVYDNPSPVFPVLVEYVAVYTYELFPLVAPILGCYKFQGGQVIRAKKQLIRNIPVQIIGPLL